MTQTTRMGNQKNPALLRDTDLGAGDRTVGTGYPIIAEGLRAIISAIGWDRVATIAAALTTRYNALKAVPTRMGSEVAYINNVLTAQVGKKLAVVLPPYDGVPTGVVTYQWVRGTNTNIGGATSQTYVPTVADVGATLKCTITVTNSEGNFSETTPVTNLVLAA